MPNESSLHPCLQREKVRENKKYTNLLEQSEYSAKVRQSKLLTHKRQVHRFYKIPSQDWGASQCQCTPSSLRRRSLHIRTAKYLVIISVHQTCPTHSHQHTDKTNISHTILVPAMRLLPASQVSSEQGSSSYLICSIADYHAMIYLGSPL